MIELTVTSNEHEVEPHGFDAVHVTVVTPEGNVDPEGGEQLIGPVGVPAEVNVGSVQVATFVLQRSISSGQAPITGVSLIVTLKAQKSDPHVFVAVQVTVEVPAGKVEPDAGEQTTVAAGNPVAGGVGKNTSCISHWVYGPGHGAICGPSFIVTVNEQEDEPQLFVAVQVTVVVPGVNDEPEFGLHMTDADGVPVAVGSAHVAV